MNETVEGWRGWEKKWERCEFTWRDRRVAWVNEGTLRFEIWPSESDKVTEEEAEIGVCVSKPKGPRRGSSSEPAVAFSPPDSPSMKSLFKPKPRTPSDIVRHTRDLLRLTNRDDDKVWTFALASHLSFSGSYHFSLFLFSFLQTAELTKNLRELKTILYGNSESEPVPEACAQLTQEFFKENTLRLLILCLPKLNLEVIAWYRRHRLFN